MHNRKKNISESGQVIPVRVWTAKKQDIDRFIQNYFTDNVEVISVKSYKNKLGDSGYYHYLLIKEETNASEKSK